MFGVNVSLQQCAPHELLLAGRLGATRHRQALDSEQALYIVT
jgi:hypothetical protein